MQKPLTALNVTKAPYTFQRSTPEPKDTLAHGVGRSGRYTGMVRGAFLPSDDAQIYPYHIPGNVMAVVELRATSRLLRSLPNTTDDDDTLALELDGLAAENYRGIQTY